MYYLAITILKNIELDFVDDQVKAQREAGELVKECQTKAKTRLVAAGTDASEIQASMDDLVKCVEVGVAETLARANEEIAFQANVRKGMAEFMENYTCADPDMESSEFIREETWWKSKDHKPRNVKIMFDRPASKIHVVEDFISVEECEAMAKAAEPQLHRATVADGKVRHGMLSWAKLHKPILFYSHLLALISFSNFFFPFKKFIQGGSRLSEHRKAMQAGITVDWSKESEGDKIAILSRRVYDYTNHVLGLGIEEFGQEDLMSIQYFGRGENDTAPDRYEK